MKDPVSNEKITEINRINLKYDIQKLDLLYRQILKINFNNKDSITIQDKITKEISEQLNILMKENNITNEEYANIIEQNKDNMKWEDRKEKLAQDRLYMIWENCSHKEVAEILRNNYDYEDEEILDEFEDEETREEVKQHLTELTEIEEAQKNVVLKNGYIFVFENEFYFSKLKRDCEQSKDFANIKEGLEIATITNADVTKEAFLVKYDNNIEIIYNYYNKVANEMETYEYEVFDLNEINSKQELIEAMTDKLEKFEEKYNRLEKNEEENIEV